MADKLSTIFGALADPTRRAMLARLAVGEASVTELAEPFAISLPAISRHLRVLQEAGLVSRRRSGQWRPCRLDAAGLTRADAWMAPYRQFFTERFDRLGDQLTAPNSAAPIPAAINPTVPNPTVANPAVPDPTVPSPAVPSPTGKEDHVGSSS